MYTTINPAVAKSIMTRMDGFQLQTEIAFFETELQNIEPGNLRTMYLNLRAFAKRRLNALIQKNDSYEFEF
ncbi:MAG: hypothetical protein ACK5B9_06495 [Flavobacteriia bacterium]|jgi:hypothetical protein